MCIFRCAFELGSAIQHFCLLLEHWHPHAAVGTAGEGGWMVPGLKHPPIPQNLQLQKILQPNGYNRESAGGWCFWLALLSSSKMILWLGGRWDEKSRFLILNQRLSFWMFIYFLIFLFVWNFWAEHGVRLEKTMLLVLKASWRKYRSNQKNISKLCLEKEGTWNCPFQFAPLETKFSHVKMVQINRWLGLC